MRGLWRRLFDTLTRMEPGDVQAIDSTAAKAHRSAAGGKGGPKHRRLVARAAVAPRKSTRRRGKLGWPRRRSVAPRLAATGRVGLCLIVSEPGVDRVGVHGLRRPGASRVDRSS